MNGQQPAGAAGEVSVVKARIRQAGVGEMDGQPVLVLDIAGDVGGRTTFAVPLGDGRAVLMALATTFTPPPTSRIVVPSRGSMN